MYKHKYKKCTCMSRKCGSERQLYLGCTDLWFYELIFCIMVYDYLVNVSGQEITTDKQKVPPIFCLLIAKIIIQDNKLTHIGDMNVVHISGKYELDETRLLFSKCLCTIILIYKEWSTT